MVLNTFLSCQNSKTFTQPFEGCHILHLQSLFYIYATIHTFPYSFTTSTANAMTRYVPYCHQLKLLQPRLPCYICKVNSPLPFPKYSFDNNGIPLQKFFCQEPSCWVKDFTVEASLNITILITSNLGSIFFLSAIAT